MKSKLVKGAFFVTLASLLVKVLSIVYKIPYQNITGDHGFYIYQQLYPVYSLFVSMGAFALPLAISETLNNKNEKKTLSSVFFSLLMIVLPLVLLIMLFNRPLGFLFNDLNLSPLFYPLIPVLFLIPVISVIRGYLYTHPESLNRVGFSQIIEQLFRVLFIILILYQFKNFVIQDPYDVAKFSFLGFGIGLLIASLYLILNFNYRLISLKSFDFKYGFKLIKRSLFLLISASVLILLQLIDSLTIIKTLSKTMELNEAMILKGIYDRGLPLIQTAIFFVAPLISSFIPHLKTKEEHGKLLMLIILLSLPATLGMIFVTEDLNVLLYKDQQLTLTLQINSVIIFFYAVFLTLASIIKNTKGLTLIIILGLILKYSLNIILISNLGIDGAPISSVITLIVLILLIIVFIKINIRLNKTVLFQIIISSLMMIVILAVLNKYISNLFLNIILGILVYFGSLFALRIDESELLIK